MFLNEHINDILFIYIIMNKIENNGTFYNIHPIYDRYASDECGHIIDIREKNTYYPIYKRRKNLS